MTDRPPPESSSARQEPAGGRHRFGRPRLLAGDGPYTNQTYAQGFQPLPAPTGPAPYHLDLASVLGAAAVDGFASTGSMAFHMVGDIGGIANPLPQLDVAAAIEADLADAAGGWEPSFLYVLGDCVYFYGQPAQYYPQLYEPYAHYTAPILAVPGNHDGDPQDAAQTSLDGFVANFCTPTPVVNTSAGDTGRTTMTQPNVYWTLVSPLLTVVGLYTNVPEYGELDSDQTAWLESELAAAPADRALMVALHHPPISADAYHSSSAPMLAALDAAMTASKRIPDMICAGHVHGYQRHSRDASAVGGSGTIPYLVAGHGGYHNLHALASDVAGLALPAPFPNMAGVTIEAADDSHYGYTRVQVTRTALSLQAVRVAPVPGVATTAITRDVIDSVTVPLRLGT